MVFPRGLRAPGRAVILHNVDVVSTIDLTRMVQFHKENKALATLAVKDREPYDICSSTISSSYADANTGAIKSPNSCALHPCAGVGFLRHSRYISHLLTMMTEEGTFPSLPPTCVSLPNRRRFSPSAPMSTLARSRQAGKCIASRAGPRAKDLSTLSLLHPNFRECTESGMTND